MATVGMGNLKTEAFGFFDAMRSYDAKTASSFMAKDATFQSPWSNGILRGAEAIEEYMTTWLGDALNRPSFTIKDVQGDGARVLLVLSVSGRFGRNPQQVTMAILTVHDKVHQVRFS